MSVKNIIVIAEHDYLTQPNGGEVYLLHNFLSASRQERYQYCLVGLTFNADMEEGKWYELVINEKVYPFLPVVKITKDKEKTKIPLRLRVWLGLYRYRHAIEEKHADVYYVHAPELGAPFWNQKKIVYHVHGNPYMTLTFSRFPLFRGAVWTKLYSALFIERAIKKSERIIWAASRAKEMFLEKCPHLYALTEPKSCVIHSSFDIRLIPNRARVADLPERTHLVTVGRLAKIKRIDRLISVTAKLAQDGCDVDLLICGDGEERDALRKLAEELRITDRIRFLGVADRELIATVLDVSRAFLFASVSEAMSLVVLESLYMGTPVVTTDVGDVAEVVMDGVTGYVVPAKEEDAFPEELYIERVKAVLQNGKRFYQENCKRIASGYTPERMAEAIDSVLEDVASETTSINQ